MHKSSLALLFRLFFITFFLVSCSKDKVNSPPQTPKIEVDDIKTLGGSKNESAQAVVNTADGGYAILGYAQSMDGDVTNKSNESYDYWILKYNSTNQIQWQKTYGGSDDDRGADLIQTSDGGYAIIGKSKSNDLEVSENLCFDIC